MFCNCPLINRLLILGKSVKLPVMSLCLGPKAKKSVLKKYNMSDTALDEPNFKEKKTLRNSNKTIKDLFLEATYKLDVDFSLNITFNSYGSEGKISLQKEFHLDANIFQVRILSKELEMFRYCIVTSFNTSHLEAHPGIFRLLMKGILDTYLL
jgi:hypothetical protein